MGNRAVIALGDEHDAPAIYVHWNGGAESVLAFLQAARLLEVRDPTADPGHAAARLVQIIGNFFGGTLSIAVGTGRSLAGAAGWDNGVYTVGSGWQIVKRDRPGPRSRQELPSTEAIQKYHDVLSETLAANALPFSADRRRGIDSGRDDPSFADLGEWVDLLGELASEATAAGRSAAPAPLTPQQTGTALANPDGADALQAAADDARRAAGAARAARLQMLRLWLLEQCHRQVQAMAEAQQQQQPTAAPRADTDAGGQA